MKKKSTTKTTKPVKKRKNFAKAGSTFEREIIKELSLWWSEGERDDIFTRSATSGGRATTRAKKGKTTANSAGDVAYLDEDGREFLRAFTLELKKGYPSVCLQQVVDAKSAKPGPVAWFDQAFESAKVAGSISWMVIGRKNNMRTIVYLPYGVWRTLSDRSVVPSAVLHPGCGHGPIICMRFADFLTSVTRYAVEALLGDDEMDTVYHDQ